MSLDKFKSKLRSYKRILESDTLGSFDFFTCIICLDSIDNDRFNEFLEAIAAKNYLVLGKVTPLAVHEFTHFVDSTSTVWGMNHLRKMNEAYCSNNAMGGSEYEFYKAKRFLEHARSLRLPDYYTLIDGSKTPDRPWQSRITMGKKFGLDGKLSGEPVLFSHFSNAHGDLLARSPVSTVSILEASAMANEVITRLSLINELDDADKLVENGAYQRESLSFIYNQNITEYSVCVHIVANCLLCKDIFVAFQICSIITRLVLNFPSTLIENVLASEIHDILDIPKDHEFEKRVRSGIRGRDLGILYFLICSALPKNTADDPKAMIAGIRLALEKINLSLDLLREEARKEIESIANDLNDSKLKAIRLLSRAGFDNFSKIPFTTSGLNVSDLSLPSVYLGDGTEVDIFRNDNSQLKDVGIEEIFDELYAGQEWVERFSEACTA
jgi:hypothetical protein